MIAISETFGEIWRYPTRESLRLPYKVNIPTLFRKERERRMRRLTPMRMKGGTLAIFIDLSDSIATCWPVG